MRQVNVFLKSGPHLGDSLVKDAPSLNWSFFCLLLTCFESKSWLSNNQDLFVEHIEAEHASDEGRFDNVLYFRFRSSFSFGVFEIKRGRQSGWKLHCERDIVEARV